MPANSEKRVELNFKKSYICSVAILNNILVLLFSKPTMFRLPTQQQTNKSNTVVFFILCFGINNTLQHNHMNYLNRLIVIFIFISLGISNSLSAQLFINEIMAKNDNVIADEAGEFDDWIELYNAGTSPVNLAGYYFSEEITDPTFWEIPDTDPSLTTIPAGGYLIIWADKDPEQGPHHIDFKLSADGQEIYLYGPDGSTLVD